MKRPKAKPAKLGESGPKRCDHCGRTMEPGKGRRRVYCSGACRQAAYRQRRDAVTVA